MTYRLTSCCSSRVLTSRTESCVRDRQELSIYPAHHITLHVCGARIVAGSSAKLDKATKAFICREFKRQTNALSHQHPTGPVSRFLKWNAIRNGTADGSGDDTVSSMPNNSEQSEKSHLELLRQMTSNKAGRALGRTISEQLMESSQINDDDEFTIPLGNGQLEMEPLTISQKRNIRRQDYLNQVARRNDSRFFTILALVLLVPPAVILGVAVATGYVDLTP